MASDSGDRSGIMGSKSLTQLAHEGVWRLLKSFLDGEKPTAGSCCGGTLPISGPIGLSSQGTFTFGHKSPKTIQLYWDVLNSDRIAQKIRLPVPMSEKESQYQNFEDLWRTCIPAILGPLDTNQTNDSCRKLDPSRFAVNFHPQDYHVIDTINQYSNTQTGISCELYSSLCEYGQTLCVLET